MPQRFPTPLLLVCAAFGVACGGANGSFEPAQSVFTTLDVTPADYALASVAPGNTLQLTVRAYNQARQSMDGTEVAAYSSSAPEIAGVSSSGFVSAGTPGTAEITAALTLGGVTRTASMRVTVQARDNSDIAGVYDLTAPIAAFDPVWGDLKGYRYTAVLTLQKESGPPWFGGTYADLRLIGPAGDSSAVADSGPLNGSIDPRGRVVLVLDDGGFGIGLTLILGTAASGAIDGTFGCCGHIGGAFTAERR
jgi:hypothetical protein